MRKILPVLLFVSVAAIADGPTPPSTEDVLVAQLSTAKFADVTTPNAPKGMQAAVIGVDPATKGGTAYSKTPAGTGLAAHWHSFAEYTALLQGKGTLMINGKSQEVGPGSYFVIPAKTPHQFTCAAGADCYMLTRRAGPADYNFVNKT